MPDAASGARSCCGIKGCRFSHESKEALLTHQEKEHNCGHCDDACKNSAALNTHIQNEHSICDCEVTYLGDIISVQRNVETGVFTCPCSQRWKNVASFKRHVQSHQAPAGSGGSKVTSEAPQRRKARRPVPYPAAARAPPTPVAPRVAEAHDDSDPDMMALDKPTAAGASAPPAGPHASEAHDDSDPNTMELDRPTAAGASAAPAGRHEPEAHDDSEPNAMELDEPAVPHLKSIPFLNSVGFQLHMVFSILICMLCRKAWKPSGVISHSLTHHARPPRHSSDRLKELIEEYGIEEHPTLIIPAPGGAPQKGLHVHHNGYACTHPSCAYAGLQRGTLMTHWQKSHRDSMPVVPTDKRYDHPVPVQSFYAQDHNTYWVVNPDLADRPKHDLYSTFVKSFVPKIKDNPVQNPKSDRDIHPWFKACQFHLYLGDYITNTEKRTTLVETALRPAVADPTFGILHDWVFEYFSDTRDIARDIDRSFLKALLEYPPRNKDGGEAWAPLDSDKRLRSYGSPLVCLLAYFTKSLKRPGTLQLPTTDIQRAMAEKLLTALEERKKDIDLVHQLLYSFTAPPATDTMPHKWDDPLLCYMAISNLSMDGSLTPVKLTTQEFAMWTYSFRNSGLFEIVKGKTSLKELQDASATICSERLSEGVVSPYNTLRDLQHIACALTHAETPAPLVTISEDVMSFGIHSKWLRLADWRSGSNKLFAEVEERLAKVMNGPPIPYTIPEDLVDDMNDRTMGYSWLDNARFTQAEHPLLQRHFDDPNSKLGYMEGDDFHFHAGPAMDLMDDFSFINRGLSALSEWCNSQATRVTQHVDMRIRNSHRRRNVFRSLGIARHVLQYSKTTNLRKTDSFLPVLLSERMAKLEDMYLILCRPAEEYIAEYIWGTESRMIYREYLYVQMGQRVTETIFYSQFKVFTATYLGVMILISEWRHLNIAIMREYIEEVHWLKQKGSSVSDAASDHSTDMARRMYANLVGSIPWLSMDAMWWFDAFCRMWHDVADVGRNSPPIALRLLRRNYRPSTSSAIGSSTAVVATSTPSGDMEKTVQMLVQSVHDLKEEVHQQSLAFNSAFHTLQHGLKHDMESAIVRALATLHPQGFTQNGRATFNSEADIRGSAPFHGGNSSEHGIDNRRVLGSYPDDASMLPAGPLPNEDVALPFADAYMDNDGPSGVDHIAALPANAVTEEHVLKVMATALGVEKAAWKSDEQRRSVMFTLDPSKHLVSVMGTGQGKSMTWVIPALIQDTVSVVIVPYRGLLQQHLSSALRMGCRAIQWSFGVPISTANKNLIFVSVETAASKRFLRFLQDIHALRLFGDEAHEFMLNDIFRADFLKVWSIALTDMQRIYLSATLPKSYIQRFLEGVAIKSDFCRFVRGPTNRPELRYHVVRVNAGLKSVTSVVSNLARYVQKEMFTAESRGIIFAATIPMAKTLASDMKCLVHYSAQGSVENDLNRNAWLQGHREGETTPEPWIAATPGLINGIDYPRTDCVIFGELGPGGVFGGVQGSGRGGRTDHPCMVFFVYSGQCTWAAQENDLCGLGAMTKWVTIYQCRRLTPSGYMDDNPLTCEQLKAIFPQTQFCDFCDPNTSIMSLIRMAVEDASESSHETPMQGVGIDSRPTSEGMISNDEEQFDGDDDELFASIPDSMLVPALGGVSSPVVGEPTAELRTVRSGASSSIVERGNAAEPPTPSGSKSAPMSAAHLDTTPGIALKINAELAREMLRVKCTKTAFLETVLLRVRTFCPVCYILKGEHVPRHDNPIMGCSLKLTFGMGWIEFKKLVKGAFPKFHFCYACGLPQNIGPDLFVCPSHDGLGKTCPVPDMVFLMIFAIKRNPSSWLMASKKASLETNTSDQKFAEWCGKYVQNSNSYYNGLELLIWYLMNHHTVVPRR